MSEEVFQLQEALRTNQLQIKNALQRRRHSKKREASGGLGPAGQKATIAVYLLSDQNLELSVRMLQHWAAAASPSSMDPGRIVEDLVLQTPMETLRQTFAPETQEWRLAVARAKKFLAEATARDWVAQLNVGHGVAPSATEVYWQYESVLKGTDPEARLPAARMVRKWVCCWRGRWGVRRGAIRPKLHIETPLLQAKALGIVEAFWRQVCYIRRKFATKKLVFLNLDETSIGYSLMPQAGCVTVEHGRQVPFTAKVKKENHRGCFTYVAIICTCISLQGKLPHYLLGSRARLTKAVMRGQAALPQTNLKVLAQQSAWNSSPCMVQILEEVAAVIKSVCSAGTQGVLLLDCAPCHLTPSVLKAAAVSGLQLAFVPASATHVAQPLDMAAFSGFKKWLQKEHRSLRSTSPDG
ncbi:unnamed protein product [Cladocopium goreaui]|uniref:DDE-1 domain-containing protein n=1 Tax=Cladocopium goreaui TaxID=2562237 RepID=A0A9P1DS50_9DINO|nr:unnamed protein product [Cladocopium goreaui]